MLPHLIAFCFAIVAVTCGGPVEQDVFERGLVSEKVTPNAILKHYDSYSQNLNKKRHPDVQSLVFVTPWNNHGYDAAKIWGEKFTYVSPVWFTLKPGNPKNGQHPAKLNMVIEGEHDVDKGWLNDVWYGQYASNDEKATREKRTKIVPRIRLEGLTPQLYMTFVKENDLLDLVIKNVDALCQKHGFDGIVFEPLHYGCRMPDVKDEPKLMQFFKAFSDKMHERGRSFIVVMPPPEKAATSAKGRFTANDFETLLSIGVDGVSMMTYDYSGEPGPNAPLNWIKDSIENLMKPSFEKDRSKTSKLMVGLPFYGYNYNLNTKRSDAIVANRFAEILKKHKTNMKISLEQESQEHKFTYSEGGEKYGIYFPTLHFLNKRIEAIENYGCSVAIWEIGQGFDSFFDLF